MTAILAREDRHIHHISSPTVHVPLSSLLKYMQNILSANIFKKMQIAQLRI